MKTLDVGEFKRWWLQRPAREKLMLGACSLGVVLALGDSLAISPVEKQLRKARGAEEQLQSRWDQLQSRRKGQTAQDKDLLQAETALRARLQAAQARMGALSGQMADTAQLPEVLRSLVATMGSTRLLELTFADDGAAAPVTGAAVATAASPGGAAASSAANATTGGAAGLSPARRIYRLPVTLKVSGSWAELSSLLGQVESRAPALQWQTLSLDSTEWPAIQLTLRAHVRSLQPRWGAGP
jgi:Tfp pilus assembly protein PilO